MVMCYIMLAEQNEYTAEFELYRFNFALSMKSKNAVHGGGIFTVS